MAQGASGVDVCSVTARRREGTTRMRMRMRCALCVCVQQLLSRCASTVCSWTAGRGLLFIPFPASPRVQSQTSCEVLGRVLWGGRRFQLYHLLLSV